MKQEVNYIGHHKNANMKMIELNLNPTHISLYNALFLIWNECGFDTELSINRNDIMKLSKIGSANTYTKCLKDLDKAKLLKYKPSHNPLIGSKVNLYRFDNSTDNSTGKSSSKGTGNSTDNSIATLYKLLNKETIKQINKQTKVFCDFVNNNLHLIFNEKKDVRIIEIKNKTEFEKKVGDFFSQTTEVLKMRLSSFLRSLENKGVLSEFIDQTNAYIEYKNKSNERVHGWLGYQSDWDSIDWVDKLAKFKTSTTENETASKSQGNLSELERARKILRNEQ